MVSLFLGSYTLRMSASSRLNRLFALVSLNFAVWSFAYTFFYSAPDKETAWFWYRISALGWAVAPALALHFFLVLTENDALIQRWWAKVILYLPGVFFLSEALTGTLLVSDFVPCVLGWCEVAPAFSPLFWLFQCYAIGSVVVWIVMTARWGVRSERAHVKKQAIAICVTALISLVVVAVFDTALPVLGVYVLPSIAPVVIMLWLLGIWYAMARYRLMVLTPSIAVDDIISTMSDLLILGNHEGRIIKMNARALELLGFEEKDAIGKPVAGLFRERDLVQSLCGKVLQVASRACSFEVHVMTARGRDIPFHVTFSAIRDGNGELAGLTLLGQDLRHVRKLQESERKYRSLVDNAPIGVYRTDLRGRILYVNEAIAGIYDYASPEELLAANAVTNYINRKDLLTVLASLRKTGRVVNFETEIATHAGARKCVLVSAVVEGEYLSGMLMDITYRKSMEGYVMRSRNLESLGVLAGGIAHDFNNLLTAIIGNISLARNSVDPDTKVFGKLAVAEKACDKARLLSNQLRTFSKGGQPVKSMLSIGGVVRDAAAIALSGSAVTCDFHLPDTLWDLEADEGQIGQVFHNLIINARDAMPETGRITVRAENVEHTAAEWLPLNEGRYVKVSVTDQGIGIAKEDIQRIFDPYFTTKNKGSIRGMGLGLSLSNSIIEKHKGLIAVYSTPGQGTTFNVYLPVGPAESALSGELRKRAPQAISEAGHGKVLLMDDEEMVRMVTAEMLRSKGYTVVCTADGVEAIHHYRKAMEAGAPFDLVLMDLTVHGGMGGQDTIKVLLEIDPKVKAVISSGYADDPVMAEYEKYGFLGVLHKPCTVEKLHTTIHAILSKQTGAWYEQS